MVATTRPSRSAPLKTGIGLRLPHLAEVVATCPSVGWLEIHPENFLANPHATELLLELAGRYPISVHTVGISIGSADGIDREHLRRLCDLVKVINPVLVSGHLAWSTHAGVYLNDLLPLPYDRATLDLLTRHLDEVQNALGRAYLVENPSSYVAFQTSTMSELEFLNELVNRTGCRLLCDVSNIYLSGHNMEYDPYAFIDGLPGHEMAEMHLGGFTAEEDEASFGRTVLIDTHATRITKPVWQLYAYAVTRFGAMPTIVEWDDELPPLSALVAEADQADAVATWAREAASADAG
jgi:uncharacterized protein (UPF0276 family)